MIEQLACKLGRNDEKPNIDLAVKLCEAMDAEGVQEIVGGLSSGDQAVANDCIKVLYEIGQRKPELIAAHADTFITALFAKNNRLVWGAMTALAYIAPAAPDALYARLPEIVTAYRKGSVITVDNSISVFAGLCAANDEYRAKIFPMLLEHLANCRAKEIPQHAERIAVCINLSRHAEDKGAFIKALEARAGELTDAQRARNTKLINKITQQ